MTSFDSVSTRERSIREAITLMEGRPGNKHIAGIMVVLDDQERVIGVVTDGDIRRGLAKGVSVDDPLSKVATSDPLVLPFGLPSGQLRRLVIEEARRRGKDYRRYDKLILVDNERRLVDVIRLSDVLEQTVEEKTIAVHGLGFVGLTLACTFANHGLAVTGVDINSTLIESLADATPLFYERGLEALLQSLCESGAIGFSSDTGGAKSDVHVMCVGTPLDPEQRPDLTLLKQATAGIANVLEQGDLVVYRSTVPVGAVRKELKPILEKSGLTAGDDFYLSFAPERTVEGNALEELTTLPQIIGGINQRSSELTAELFKKITNTIVEVDSLEAAELVKLVNNTYRDLVFSFANEVAMICDEYNLNAFRLIQAANEGYPRNTVPTPSPGVGGFCLTKDPIYYSNPIGSSFNPVLGRTSRDINTSGVSYVLRKLEAYCALTGNSLDQMNVFVVGLAFKGIPETSDLRNSVAVDLVRELSNTSTVRLKDHVVGIEDLAVLGATVIDDISDGFDNADAVIFMNNHPANNRFNVIEALHRAKRPLFFFDGWQMFDATEIESQRGVYYATMGYLTTRRD